jgi:hypothetical protein
MKMNLRIGMFACLFVLDCVISLGGAWMDDAGVVDAPATDPLNATCIVEGQKIRLINGRSETESAPGSATKTITSVFGKLVYGNIDGEGDGLKGTVPFTEGEVVLDGWVTIGHEERSFVPCSQARALWLPGNSPALDEVMSVYRKTLLNPMPYTPLFVTLAGKIVKPPADGFGAGYEASFFASQLVQMFPQGNCKSDLIYVECPLPGSRVTSPLRIRGHARGKWFFEGDFPVVLADANGKCIAKWYATAKKGWMTETFLPFESVITFKPPRSGSKGTLFLKKNNPTDRPEFDDALEIPVFFE